MLINCPKCDARYLVQADSMKEGRKVRCANCKHVWFQEPESKEPVEDKEADDGEGISAITNDDFISGNSKPHETKEDMDSIFASMLKAQKQKAVIGTSALLIVLFLVLGFGLISAKTTVTQMIPGMKAVYALIGMESKTVSIDNLVFDRVEVIKDEDLGGYLVSGYALNLSPEAISLPNIEVNLLNQRGLIIGQSEVFSLQEPKIEAEASQFFEYLVKTQERPSNIELKFVYAKPAVDVKQQHSEKEDAHVEAVEHAVEHETETKDTHDTEHHSEQGHH